MRVYKPKTYLIAIGFLVVLFAPLVFRLKQKPQNQPLIKPYPDLTQTDIRVEPAAGQTYEDLLSLAENWFQKALAARETVEPDQVIVYINKALEAADRAIKKDPARPSAYFTAGRIYESVINSYPSAKQQALIAYQQAYQKQPDNPLYLNTLTYFLLKTQKVSESAALLEQGLKRTPNNPAGRVILAKAYTYLGRIGPALTILTDLSPAQFTPEDYQEIQRQIKLLKKLAVLEPELSKKVPTIITPKVSPTLTEPAELAPLPVKQAESQQLVIAAPTEPKTGEILALESTNALSGKTTFPAGRLELEISHDLVRPESKIVTAVEDDINQVIYVKAKKKGGFILAVTTPLDKPVNVAYWIIQPRGL